MLCIIIYFADSIGNMIIIIAWGYYNNIGNIIIPSFNADNDLFITINNYSFFHVLTMIYSGSFPKNISKEKGIFIAGNGSPAVEKSQQELLC